MSYSSTIANILDLQEQAKNWCSGPIWFSIATSLSDGTPRKIDIGTTLGHGKQVPNILSRSDLNCYWLQSSLNTNDDDWFDQSKYWIDIYGT